MNHAYTSRYCYHDKHGDCPVECSECKAPCRCWCHRAAKEGVGPAPEARGKGGASGRDGSVQAGT